MLPADIIQVGMNHFSVCKERDSKYYIVNLGTDSVLPSCECFDWKRFMLPCKHMLAVFGCRDVSWESLSSLYRNSPYLSLETYLIDGNNSNCLAEDFFNFDDKNSDVRLEEIPKKVYPKRSKASTCRDLLQQLKSMTYLVYDLEALEV